MVYISGVFLKFKFGIQQKKAESGNLVLTRVLVGYGIMDLLDRPEETLWLKLTSRLVNGINFI